MRAALWRLGRTREGEEEGQSRHFQPGSGNKIAMMADYEPKNLKKVPKYKIARVAEYDPKNIQEVSKYKIVTEAETTKMHGKTLHVKTATEPEHSKEALEVAATKGLDGGSQTPTPPAKHHGGLPQPAQLGEW